MVLVLLLVFVQVLARFQAIKHQDRRRWRLEMVQDDRLKRKASNGEKP